MIKLSVVTINRNNVAGLERTIQSVMGQSNHNFEYIIIDGDSSDGSVELLKKFCPGSPVMSESGGILKNQQPATSWISEPDLGIYNAMNKGIRMAKGEYIHFLNSGDWLVDENVVENMLVELSQLINEGQQPDVFAGNKIMIRPDGKMRRCRNDKRQVSAFTFYRGTIEHTSAYIRRAMFESAGLYDESFRIVSDWKWYFEAVLKYDANIKFSDIYVSYFDNTGISSTNRQLEKAERRIIIENLLPKAVLTDYDRYYNDINQMERLKRYPVFYYVFYFVERICFKFEKWNIKYLSWKK